MPRRIFAVACLPLLVVVAIFAIAPGGMSLLDPTVPWPARTPAPLPVGAVALLLATEPPAPPHPENEVIGCDGSATAFLLSVHDGALVAGGPASTPLPFVWPRGFSAWLVDGVGELVDPAGKVLGRSGGEITVGGGHHICSIGDKVYEPAS